MRSRLSTRVLLAILIGIVLGVVSGGRLPTPGESLLPTAEAVHRHPVLAWAIEPGDDEEGATAELPDPSEDDGREGGEGAEPTLRDTGHLLALARVPATLTTRAAAPSTPLRARPVDRSLTARGPPRSAV